MGRRYFEGLDALRAVAAAMVLATHVGQFFPGDRPFAAGYLGVDLFFAISGFVIGEVYEADLASGRLTARRYLERRLVRLYPLIALGVVLGLLSVLALGSPVEQLGLRFAFQLAMLPTLWLGGHLFVLNGPQWSLFFEIGANLVHARVARSLTAGRLLLVTGACGLCLAEAAWTHGSADLGYTRSTFMAGFARVGFSFGAGLMVHRLRVAGRLPEGARAGWLALPGIAAAIAAAGYAGSAGADLLVIAVASPLAVAAAAGARSSPGAGRVAMIAGTLSYPVYAVQIPLTGLAGHFLGRPAWFSYTRLLIWLLVAAGVVAAAAIADRFYDLPLRRLLDRRLRLRRSFVRVWTAP